MKRLFELTAHGPEDKPDYSYLLGHDKSVVGLVSDEIQKDYQKVLGLQTGKIINAYMANHGVSADFVRASVLKLTELNLDADMVPIIIDSILLLDGESVALTVESVEKLLNTHYATFGSSYSRISDVFMSADNFNGEGQSIKFRNNWILEGYDSASGDLKFADPFAETNTDPFGSNETDPFASGEVDPFVSIVEPTKSQVTEPELTNFSSGDNDDVIFGKASAEPLSLASELDSALGVATSSELPDLSLESQEDPFALQELKDPFAVIEETNLEPPVEIELPAEPELSVDLEPLSLEEGALVSLSENPEITDILVPSETETVLEDDIVASYPNVELDEGVAALFKRDQISDLDIIDTQVGAFLLEGDENSQPSDGGLKSIIESLPTAVAYEGFEDEPNLIDEDDSSEEDGAEASAELSEHIALIQETELVGDDLPLGISTDEALVIPVLESNEETDPTPEETEVPTIALEAEPSQSEDILVADAIVSEPVLETTPYVPISARDDQSSEIEINPEQLTPKHKKVVAGVTPIPADALAVKLTPSIPSSEPEVELVSEIPDLAVLEVAASAEPIITEEETVQPAAEEEETVQPIAEEDDAFNRTSSDIESLIDPVGTVIDLGTPAEEEPVEEPQAPETKPERTSSELLRDAVYVCLSQVRTDFRKMSGMLKEVSDISDRNIGALKEAIQRYQSDSTHELSLLRELEEALEMAQSLRPVSEVRKPINEIKPAQEITKAQLGGAVTGADEVGFIYKPTLVVEQVVRRSGGKVDKKNVIEASTSNEKLMIQAAISNLRLNSEGKSNE